MSTYDNEHRHPDWAPDCRCGGCVSCQPQLTIPALVELGEN